MKQQTKNVSPWKLGALCSLCVILFVVFACSEEPHLETKGIDRQSNPIQSKMEGDVFTLVEELPEFEGGMHDEATYFETIQDLYEQHLETLDSLKSPETH